MPRRKKVVSSASATPVKTTTSRVSSRNASPSWSNNLDLKEILQAHESGNDIPLRIMRNGADRTRWRLVGTVEYGIDTYVIVVPFNERVSSHQTRYTAPASDVRKYDKSSPMS